MCEIKAELELPLRQMTSHETQYCVHTQQMNMAVALDTVDQIKKVNILLSTLEKRLA